MNRLAAGFLVSLIGVASNVPAEDLSREQIAKIQKLFREGRAYYGEKEYGRSNENYEAILKELPSVKPGDLDINRAMVLFNIGGNYALLGKKDQALETLEKAVRRGFWDYDALERSPDLATLRGAEDFKELVKTSRVGLGSIAFGLKDLTGKELTKEDYEGKVLVIDIWGTWCGPCRMEIPHFVKLQKEYKDEGLAVIGLTWERRPPNDAITKHVSSFASRNGINYPLVMLSQGRLALIPDLSGFPTTLFVGRDGTVRGRVAGYHPYEDLRARVTTLLKEKAPPKVAKGD